MKLKTCILTLCAFWFITRARAQMIDTSFHTSNDTLYMDISVTIPGKTTYRSLDYFNEQSKVVQDTIAVLTGVPTSMDPDTAALYIKGRVIWTIEYDSTAIPFPRAIIFKEKYHMNAVYGVLLSEKNLPQMIIDQARSGIQSAERWHIRSWSLIGFAFCVLICCFLAYIVIVPSPSKKISKKNISFSYGLTRSILACSIYAFFSFSNATNIAVPSQFSTGEAFLVICFFWPAIFASVVYVAFFRLIKNSLKGERVLLAH